MKICYKKMKNFTWKNVKKFQKSFHVKCKFFHFRENFFHKKCKLFHAKFYLWIFSQSSGWYTKNEICQVFFYENFLHKKFYIFSIVIFFTSVWNIFQKKWKKFQKIICENFHKLWKFFQKNVNFFQLWKISQVNPCSTNSGFCQVFWEKIFLKKFLKFSLDK